MIHIKAKLFQLMPDSFLKQKIRWICFARRYKALLPELSKVPIVQAGVDNISGQQTPFVKLKDGTVLYGKLPTEDERKYYNKPQ